MLHLDDGRSLPIRKNRVAGRPAETHTGHMTNSDQHPHYELVARAIAALAAGADTSLAELSRRLGVSEFHLQRVFGEWAGVSPKRFMQFISKERALAALRSENDVLSATLSAGLSSPGRLHDLMVSCEGVTPGEARAFGAGLRIRYGAHATALGPAFVGLTERGICHLRFIDETADPLAELREEWPEATLVADPRRGAGDARCARPPARADAALAEGNELPDQGVGGPAARARRRTRVVRLASPPRPACRRPCARSPPRWPRIRLPGWCRVTA